jgi:signal transduction histidine kinase
MILLSSALFSVVVEIMPRTAIHLPVHAFLQAPLTLLFGVLCLAAGALQVRRGLAPVGNLRTRLAELRQGQERRLDGQYPSEVQPLVNDLNTLLDTRQRAIERAVAKAGDLAHGLKTPLAILAQDADRAASNGQADLAASIQQQVARMRRQIDYHLAHARAAASGAAPGSGTLLLDAAEGLRRALLRLHVDRGITIDLQIPHDCLVRTGREDLEEMLGNLVDNACKWARSQVIVTAAIDASVVVIIVDDDGKGLAEQMREVVLRRGVRADEAAPGSGLGLAIVRDLAEVYGGSVTLERSPLGGLRARLTLPAQV